MMNLLTGGQNLCADCHVLIWLCEFCWPTAYQAGSVPEAGEYYGTNICAQLLSLAGENLSDKPSVDTIVNALVLS